MSNNKGKITLSCGNVTGEGSTGIVFLGKQKELLDWFGELDCDIQINNVNNGGTAIRIIDTDKVNKTESNKVKVEDKKEQSNNNESMVCCVCLDKQKNVLFEPCKHICCCIECSKNLNPNICPICRKIINEKTNVFI